MIGTAELLVQAACTTTSGLAIDAALQWTSTTFANAPAVIGYQFDTTEHDRRVHAGLGAVTSPDLVRLLGTLPVRERLPISALSPVERAQLRTAPHGVVARTGAEVTRLAVHPLAVNFAVVTAPSWRRGLEQAGRFAPFCARAMVLTHTPPDVQEACLEADFYGTGVIVLDGSDGKPSMLLPPAPFVRERLTVGGWLFLEQLYASVRASSSSSSCPSPPTSSAPDPA